MWFSYAYTICELCLYSIYTGIHCSLQSLWERWERKKIDWGIKLERGLSMSNLKAETTFYHICWLGFRQAVSFSKTMHLETHCRVLLPLGLYNGMLFYQLQTQSFNCADKSYTQAEVWFYCSPQEKWFGFCDSAVRVWPQLHSPAPFPELPDGCRTWSHLGAAPHNRDCLTRFI